MLAGLIAFPPCDSMRSAARRRKNRQTRNRHRSTNPHDAAKGRQTWN